MSINIPDELLELEANSGIFAIWMVFHHYGIDLNIADLVQLTEHNAEDGASGIALTVALKTLGLDVVFHTDIDPEPQARELEFYRAASLMHIPVERALTVEEIEQKMQAGRFVIAFYDTLEGVGHHSLIYSIDEKEVCFFDSFDPMPKTLFAQQRQAEGICQQAIVIDDRNFVMR
jgi:hypothetical protein